MTTGLLIISTCLSLNSRWSYKSGTLSDGAPFLVMESDVERKL
jgi:hypothetical protein